MAGPPRQQDSEPEGPTVNLAEAKARLTIHDLWQHFGFDGEPRVSCRCVFHEDRSASLSITPDGALFYCHAGCGGGDAVDFFRRACNLPHAEACRRFLALAGGSAVAFTPRPPRPKPADVVAAQAQRRQTWPTLAPGIGQPEALVALAVLRHVSREGVDLMAARGLLHFGRWMDSPAWFVTDSANVNAQARRMDGQLWGGIGAKAQTMPGSRAAWPIGAPEAQDRRVLLVCEGAPDLLAAFAFIAAHGREEDTSAVAMLGAGHAIPADALPLLASKRIRIMAHADPAGIRAAARWAEQLETVGAAVDVANLAGLLMADGSPVKDLNDCTRLDPKQTLELQNLIPCK